MLILTVAKGPDRGKVFELRDVTRVVIGRNSPDLALNDIMISRYHAKLKRDGGRWLLRDLGSRNGTKLNGERLTQVAVLKQGDHIVTGYTEFEVSFVPDAGPTTTVTQQVQASPADSSADLAERPDDSAPVFDVAAEEPAVASQAVDQTPMEESKDESGDEDELTIQSPELASPTEPSESEAPPEPAERSQVTHLTDATAQVISEAEAVDDRIEVRSAGVMQADASLHLTDESAVDTDGAAIDDSAQVDEASSAETEIERPAASPMLMNAGEDEATESSGPSESAEQTDGASLIDASSGAAATEDPPVDALTPAVVADSSPKPPEMERAASEWMSAIESQLVIAQGQGWDDLADEEDDGFIAAMDDEIESIVPEERSLLYFDEDDHWADDVQLDDEELLQSLKEDGPEALLRDLPAKALPATSPQPLVGASKPDKPRRRKR